LPAQIPLTEDYAPTVFRPKPENCDVPTLHVLADPAWPGGERPAISVHGIRKAAELLVAKRLEREFVGVYRAHHVPLKSSDSTNSVACTISA